MRIDHYLPIGLVALLVASCSTDDDVSKTVGDQTIDFGAYIEDVSRAVGKSTFEDGDVIGLYACRTTGDYANAFTTNFMNNIAVTKGEGGWTYSPISAWPTDENEHVSFVAFYPRSETASATGLTYSFTTSSDLENQVDPMWCTVKDAKISDRNGTAINGSEADAAFEATSGSVPLKFEHMLSKVRIKIKLSTDYPGISAKLNSMTLAGISQSGTFTVADNLNSGSWNESSTKGNIYLLQTTDEAKALSTDELLMGEILAIPQSLTGSTNACIEIKYTHTLAEGGEKTVSKTLYLGDSWQCNKIYNYVIKLALDVNNISISSEIANWGDEKNPAIGTTTDAPEPVDLGLSVKWASCDYATASPYVAGPKYDCYCYSMTFNSTWGPNWCIPTREQWSELFNNCTITSTTVDGVSGYIATATNGNSIFFSNSEYWTSERYAYKVSGSWNYDTYYAEIDSKTFSYSGGGWESVYRPLRLIFN